MVISAEEALDLTMSLDSNEVELTKGQLIDLLAYYRGLCIRQYEELVDIALGSG